MARLFDPQKRDSAILDLLSSLSKDPPEEGMTPEDIWRVPGLSLIIIGLIAQSYRSMERVGDAAECLPQLQSLLDLLVILSSSKAVAESFMDSSLVVALFSVLPSSTHTFVGAGVRAADLCQYCST